jgi:hypothetical protein
MNTDTGIVGYLGLLNETYGQIDSFTIEDLNFTDAFGINLTATNGYITNLSASGISGATGVLNSLTVLQNMTGPSGFIGTLGVNSITGPTGRFNSLTVNNDLTGPSGFIGTLGVNSITGPTGRFNSLTVNNNLTGPSGFIGTLGVNSITGPTGQFNSLTVNNNLTGPSGFIGTLGVNSITGPTGRFNSLTVNNNLTGPSGFIGTLGVNSITGPTGQFNSLTVNNNLTGPSGFIGTLGVNSITGPTGQFNSLTVNNNLTGPSGFIGTLGVNSITGPTGQFNSLTSSSATITGLTASRAVLTDGSDNLVSATFNLPTNSGTSSFILTTNGVSSTSWANPVGLPISSATQTALNNKAPLASPTFTGIATFADIVLNNTRISLGSSQTTSGLGTGVMIGSNLSNNSFINNIMLNGTGTTITSGGASRLYIAPIRNIGLISGVLLYDSGSKEVSYSATPTLTSITAGSATITGLSSNRAVLTDINDALTTTTFNLPTTSGTSGYVLRTDGVATTSWVDLATQSAVSSKAPLASPTFTGQVVVPKGSVSSPSIAFGSTDLNTGIYSPFDDTFAVALNGVQKLVMTTTTFEPKDVIKAVTGTNTAPCFTFQADANAGLYQSAVNNIDIAVNQVNKVNITQTLFHSKNNIQMTSASTDTYLVHGSGNTLFKTTGLSGKYITSNIYAGAQTDTWSVLETNADAETAAFCQNGETSIIINPADADALWFQDEDNMTTATNYAWVGWKITLAGVLVASSDRRLKRDINKIEKENLLDSLLDINIVKYKKRPPSEDKLFKNGVLRKKYQQEHMGVIGQNVKKNFPDVIEEQDNGDEEKLISVKYQDLSYYFHLGTQELIRKVQVLEEENKTLRTEINNIKTFLNI